MKVTVPAEIQVGGHVFQIQRVRGLADRRQLDGNSSYPYLLIELETDRAPSMLTATFFHEAFHVAANVFRGGEGKISEKDHRVHDALAEMLTQILPQLGIELDFSELPMKDAVR